MWSNFLYLPSSIAVVSHTSHHTQKRHDTNHDEYEQLVISRYTFMQKNLQLHAFLCQIFTLLYVIVRKYRAQNLMSQLSECGM